MSFPDNCIRGVPNTSFLNDEGSVGSHLFYFTNGRDDGWIEQSINWEDDDSVVEFTLQQRKADGELQFKAGAVVVPLEEIDRLNNRPTVKGLLSCERKPLKNNPSHGNILLRSNTSKQTMKLIAAGLALAVTKIVRHQHD
ncbi:MAG: hypothetical protein L0229_04640 [Blastocatellia bacterium]|nr:hypothetical protein [Blastocatellia bacterium]